MTEMRIGIIASMRASAALPPAPSVEPPRGESAPVRRGI
jgi:hypothetical protein